MGSQQWRELPMGKHMPLHMDEVSPIVDETETTVQETNEVAQGGVVQRKSPVVWCFPSLVSRVKSNNKSCNNLRLQWLQTRVLGSTL